jgi:hypothetical protein
MRKEYEAKVEYVEGVPRRFHGIHLNRPIVLKCEGSGYVRAKQKSCGFSPVSRRISHNQNQECGKARFLLEFIGEKDHIHHFALRSLWREFIVDQAFVGIDRHNDVKIDFHGHSGTEATHIQLLPKKNEEGKVEIFFPKKHLFLNCHKDFTPLNTIDKFLTATEHGGATFEIFSYDRYCRKQKISILKIEQSDLPS